MQTSDSAWDSIGMLIVELEERLRLTVEGKELELTSIFMLLRQKHTTTYDG